MQEMLQRLKMTTKKCRADMHEPDKQDLNFFIGGDHLDNAMGDNPKYNNGEHYLGIEDMEDGHVEYFNLATLIALARKAKP